MKKLKLSLSICMMCLCVAVLCMGILAAGSATYSITGKISYNMIDYVARTNTRVYKVQGKKDISGLTTVVNTLSTMTFEDIERTTTTYYVPAGTLNAQTTTKTSDTETTFLGNFDFEYGAVDSSVYYYTFFVVININNISDDYSLTASITNNDTNKTALTSSDTSYIYTNATQTSILKDETRNIVVGFSLKSEPTENIEENFSYALTITCSDPPAPTLADLTLLEDTTDDYYYVELGQKSDTDTTKLRWRLISVDGTTKYNYVEGTTPTLQSGSIFMQQTLLESATMPWGDTAVACDYFSECTIKPKIEKGDIFNLTSQEKRIMKNVISNKQIDHVDFLHPFSGGDSANLYLSDSAYTFNYDENNPRVVEWRKTVTIEMPENQINYFWLPSIRELFIYVNGTTLADSQKTMDIGDSDWNNLKWLDGCWTRTPMWIYDTSKGDSSYGCIGQIINGACRVFYTSFESNQRTNSLTNSDLRACFSIA